MMKGYVKKNNTRHIRISKLDLEKWKRYCELTGMKSPTLFSKIMKSEKINLNDRIVQEYHKREEALRRKLERL